ncbi:aspartic proteinase nepenthesin-1-like [Oryza brachyantha]|uniref:aspartic proteinase nepenthesin-1-like n=1 Tax=Oryza brachyantha TaxID=4533 RepID=UPI001ADB2C67|nr:aspartic proteinase nepenthesin-1-like [Oryza brachyantha]
MAANNKLPLIFALLFSVPLISFAARVPSPVAGRGAGHSLDDIGRGIFHWIKERRNHSYEGQFNGGHWGYLSSSSGGAAVQEDHIAPHLLLGIGTPAVNITLVFDTTSDLLWTQCHPCLDCVPQAGHIYDPSKSKTFANLTKHYNYSYSEEAFTSGYLATETFAMGDATVPNITFGCGTRNQGYYDNVAGVVGLGRGGAVSLLSQLGFDRFSYCFSSSDAPGSSYVSLGGSGELANNNTLAASTPMVADPVLKSGYFVRLVGVTVGATRVAAGGAAAGGGLSLVIDSTSPATVLDEATYAQVRRELVAQLKPLKEANANANASANVGLNLCFQLAAGGGTAPPTPPPNVTLHFDGGADLVLLPANYLAEDSASGLLCLTMMAWKGVPVLGSLALMDTHVLYDLAKNVVSFQPLDCAARG